MMTWYHGGRPGLPVGSWLLPPVITGAPTCGDLYEALFGATIWQDGMEPDRARTDLVYFTTARDLARGHAAAVPLTGRGLYGTVYEALPAALAPDPDIDPGFPGLSVQAPFGLVLRIVERRVLLNSRQMATILHRYTTDETRAYMAADMEERWAPTTT